jgi:hypothetical protein
LAETNSNESQNYDEYGSPFEEFSFAKEDADTGHEYVPPHDKDYVNKKSKSGKKFIQRHGVMVMQTAAAVLAVVVVKDAFGYDLLAHDPFNDRTSDHLVMTSYADDFDYYEPEPEPEPETKPAYEPTVSDHPKDEADDAFPVLSNLEPNGYVPGFGVLDEEYVRFENIDGSVNYLYCTDGMWNRTNEWWIDSEGVHFEGGVVITDYYYAPNSDYETESAKISNQAGSAWYNGRDFLWIPGAQANGLTEPLYRTLPIGPIPGASYDEATNTLTLTNFTGDYLNANLMGNGFKLKLVGDNNLKGIVVWGFMYGGSLTVTGDGTLTIEHKDVPGIRLECENSDSCLMIDKDVRLVIEGTGPHILVTDSTHEKGIYYLKPLTVKDHRTGDYLVRVQSSSDGHTYWEFKTENETNVTGLIVDSKED